MRTATRLNALRALEATARLGGYAAAAEEIGVTPEAVGQLVRGLERDLDAALFARATAGPGRGLDPTPSLRAELPRLTRAFAALSASLEALRDAEAGPALVVSAPPSLTSVWLMPLLPRFLAANPGIDLRLDVTDRLRDVARGEADAALRFGPRGDDGLVAHTLVEHERLIVVASPGRLSAHGEPADDGALQEHPLISDATLASPFPGWSDWFATSDAGEEDRYGRRTPTVEFNASLPAIDAAVRGQGIALLRERLVSDELRAGTLVRLFADRSLPTGRGYRLVTTTAPRAEAEAFARWFVEALASRSD